MISKRLVIGSLFAAAAALSTKTTAVQADPILTSGVICGNGTPGQAEDFQRFTNAFVNVNAAVRLAVCAVPRSPALPAGAKPTCIFNGVGGICTATSYQPNGTVQAQINFMLPATVAFPAAVAGPTNYVTLSCNLNGSLAGAIFGLTAAN